MRRRVHDSADDLAAVLSAITRRIMALCSAPSMRSAQTSDRSARAFRAALQGLDRACAQRKFGAYVNADVPAKELAGGNCRDVRRAQTGSRPPQAPVRAGAQRRVWTRASTARPSRAAGGDARRVAHILPVDLDNGFLAALQRDISPVLSRSTSSASRTTACRAHPIDRPRSSITCHITQKFRPENAARKPPKSDENCSES